MKSTSKKRTPSIVNLTVKRCYLTEREIERYSQSPDRPCASTLPNVLVAPGLSIACCGGGNGRVGRLENEVGTLAFGCR